MTTHQSTGLIQFLMRDSTEVLRIGRDGITANPAVPVDEIAQTVLKAIEQNIKVLVQQAVEDEREACAQVCESMRPSKSEFDQRYYAGCTDSAAAIRAREDK